MRADVYLFSHGYARSRQAAKVLIESGNVRINGKIVIKPAFDIDESQEFEISIDQKPRFVSRGGEKLDFALEHFNIDVMGMTCIDIGASTGGFTDCLIKRGAKHVYALDSGHSQLDPHLAQSRQVTSIEKYNARFIDTNDFPQKFEIAVMDVSFISQTFIHSGIFSVLKKDGILISLIKPQFECGRSALNSHGIIKSSSYHIQSINRIIDSALINGFSCLDIVRSPIEGGSGNTEFLIYLQKSDAPKNSIDDAKIKSVTKSK